MGGALSFGSPFHMDMCVERRPCLTKIENDGAFPKKCVTAYNPITGE